MIGVYVLIAVVVVLAIAVAGVLLLTLRRLKERRAKLLSELSTSPRLVPDRAFNRLEMARREAGILGRQGVDTAHARALIAQSQAAFDQGQFTRAYELAQSAHEDLVHVRQTGAPLTARAGTATPTYPPASPGPSPFPSSPTPFPSAAPTSSGVAPDLGPPPAPRLATNRAESQFQLRLLDSDLDSARANRGSAPAIATATALRSQAQQAFDRAQYTEALRFALRGRRELGGKVETLAAGPVAGAAPAGPNGDSNDAEAVAERAASGSRCPQCGYPTRANDVFCRGCGRPFTPAACPNCGTPRAPTDTFCGKCGTRFS